MKAKVLQLISAHFDSRSQAVLLRSLAEIKSEKQKLDSRLKNKTNSKY